MIASFFAMTGFEASASLQNQQKTDFGIHFDDTTRKLKVLQLPDIQTSVSGGAITERTRETVRLLMQRYNPDVILLTGDQTQGGSTSTKSQWEDAVDRAYNLFTPYMKSTCKVIAMPGNHEYDFGSLNHQWEYQMEKSYFIDWDNNFSTIDLDGAPGAGNVTVQAWSSDEVAAAQKDSNGNPAPKPNGVALNFALFNSKGDEDDGWLRPGGDNDTYYQQIVDWYTNMNNTLAGSQYSYKAQVTGQPSAYVPTFASQHVILQEIYTTGALIQADSTNGVPTPDRYTHVTDWQYIRLDPANNPSGVMAEAPCPTWLYKGATTALYDALRLPGNCLGMTFGHDHDNYFDVVDDNGFRFIMGGALTQENYNTDQNPKGRYFEFTLDDATGEVSMTTEVKSYTQLTVTGSADVDEERIEAINGEGVQLVNTLSVPKTVYVGAAENLADVRAKQEFGNSVQTQLLDYKTKQPYDQDLAVSYCLPSGATDVTFSAHRTAANAQATLTNLGTENTSEGVLYKYAIKDESILTAGEYINYSVKYTFSGVEYEIRNSTVVESIKQPAGYNDWFRGWRQSNNSKHYVDLAYISTLSGTGAYSVARDVTTNQDKFNSNTYYNYSLMIADVDQSWINHAGDNRFSMFRFSPSREEVTEGQVSQRTITASPKTDIYFDVSALNKVSATDSRLDTGVSIDFWIQKDLDRGFQEYVAGIGFYDGDYGFNPSGATVDPSDSYASYNAAVTAENNSTGSDGAQDNATIFLYDSYARQQSLNGLGTTHVNANLSADNLIGKMAGQYKGYPLVVDSKEAALALNGTGMTMFTGVRNKGNSEGGYRILLYAVSPFYLYFHTYDKGALRELTMSELMNPRKQSDYPNATQQMWDAYTTAYQNALNCYAQIKTNQTEVNTFHTQLQSAIAALLNSNKGKPSTEGLLNNTSEFTSVAVPPIIYVSGNQIQTAAPYTDRSLVYEVPTNATDVKCTVVNEGNDNVNSAVTTSTSQNGTKWTTTITGGTATAGNSIYYKLTYSLDNNKDGVKDDINKDGKADVYTQYAASYVKSVPNTEGVWATRTRRNGGFWNGSVQKNTRIHLDATVTLENNILSSRGVSGIVALYGGVQGTSFESTVVNGTHNSYSRYGTGEKVGWSVGTSTWGNGGYNAKAGRVTFYQNRDAVYLSYTTHKDAYYNGLYNYTEDSGSRNSDEYIVTHIYFDPQATGASIKPQLKMTLVAVDGHQPWVRRYWDTSTYNGTKYGGKYTANTISSSDMFAFSNTGNNWENENDDDGKIITDIVNGTTYTMYFNTVNALSSYNTSYSRMILQSEKSDGGDYNYSTIGFAFVLNRVDRSNAHAMITYVTGQATDGTIVGFQEDDMDPAWWSQWRTEVMKAYTACGNLWGTDFDSNLLVNLWQNPVYKDADYSKLVSTLAKITGLGLTAGSNESVPDYESLTFAIASGDDQRYAGQRYAKDMFFNNAADLIATIKNRTTVYAETDSQLIAASDVAGNLHDAHLDLRFQSYINDYADDLQEAWDKLRLAPADYTAFDKYTNYYNSTNDTILFMRDEYAGYHNDGTAKNYANEKALASGIYTYTTYTAFKNSLNIDRTLKKPSENASVTVYEKNSDGGYVATTKKLDRLYPQTFTYKNVTSPDVPDTTNCLYNTARDAYEALEFRKAGEYYSDDGTYTENGVTYFANYNKSDRGSSYLYTPVFKTSYNSLAADIANAGFVVTDNKVKETYNKGNNGDTNGNGAYDAGEIWVSNGAGEYIKAINPWTDASWGGASYGFKNSYEENLLNATSTYQSTNDSSKWILALYVEAEILPDIASVDYYYEKLVPSSYDMSQLEIQKNSYAEYEKGGSNYANLEQYVIYDANGNELKDGAQWYTADTWAEYLRTKTAQPGIIDGATLAENQDAINHMTQIIYQKRAALKLRPMDDFRVNDANAILGETTFADINTAAGVYNTEIADKVVKVFKSRYDAPQSIGQVQGNALYFTDHPYYTTDYKNNMSAAYQAIQGYSGKPMATNIAGYKSAIDDYVALYNTRESNLNAADYSGLTMLLNKTWIPTYEQYGEGNRPENQWALGMDKTGANWYTAESWTAYYNARQEAMKFFVGQNAYSTQSGYNQAYGDAGANGIATNGLKVDAQGDGAVDVEGSINKATYDLLVAYYKLGFKKINEFDGTIAGLTGTYASINEQLDAMLLEKENETVDVVIVNAQGQLETVKRSVYSPTQIALARTFKDNIINLANENLGPNYTEYVNAVNNYKTVIDNLEKNAAPVYLDGWNSIIKHLNDNAGDTITIADSGTMSSYFNAVFGTGVNGFNPATVYAENGMSINNIFSNKAMYDGFGLTAKQGQVHYNALITNLYNELHAASFVPAQVTRAEDNATAKLNESTKAAYDPLQLNGRDKVLETSKFTADSVIAAKAVINATKANKVTLWDTNTTVTGYNDNAGNVIDGTLADEIWAAVGLASESGDKDYDGADRDERYLLVEGGQFLDALNDAIEYANDELYGDDGEYKKFEIVNGAGEVSYGNLFTDESVAELVDALAAAEALTDTTSQDVIDQWVFDILENTDIDNKIKLTTEAGGFYGDLSKEADDEGLKYSPADYTFFNEELGKIFEAESDGAWELVYQVWLDNGDGTFTLDNELGSKYFTSDTWTPYQTAYLLATKADRNLTAKDQAIINAHTTEVHDTREILTWKGLDDSTQTLIDSIGAQIDSLSTTFVTVNTYTNSTVYVDENGNRVITDPSIGTIELSPYGDISEITTLWNQFCVKYLQDGEIDVTKQQMLLDELVVIQDLLANLETKKFDVEEDNEFTIGVRNLVDNFIAGSYTYNGIGSGDGIGTYTADYLATTVDEKNIPAAEKDIRSAQQIAIQNKLNAIYTVLGSNYEVGDVYLDYSTGVAVRYETALEAVNVLTEDLFNYVTGTRAQYAGFGLDMRQDMYKFLATEITVKVDYRSSATQPLYTKEVPLFTNDIRQSAKLAIDGDGQEDRGAFGTTENWPTINLLDDSIGITLDETTHPDQLVFADVDENGEVIGEVLVGKEIVSLVGGYSYLYGDARSQINNHDANALVWLTSEAVHDTGSEIYVLASPAGEVIINDAEFGYNMNAVPARKDGDWYTNGYGIDIYQDGSMYYLAQGEDFESVTGSSYGGWFTDDSYKAVLNQKEASAEFLAYQKKNYGYGPVAAEVMAGIEREATNNAVCWTAENRDAFISAVQADQKAVDTATVAMYEKLCGLKLLNATDAYREVATLIYEALGLVPTYKEDNKTDIIIVDDTVGKTEANSLGGRVFNMSILSDLDDLSTPEVDYKIITDDDGNIYYYSTKLPASYDGGTEAVEYILETVFGNELTNKYTIDKAALVNGDTNSVKSRIIAELEKLGLGKADLSQITSLVKAFLYNNPSNAASLGSYDIDDNGVGEEFFTSTHTTLGTTGNAFIYRNDKIMKGAGEGVFHASGFYDFTKYTDTSLRAVIEFLGDNDIINATVQAAANNFNITNKTGFDIEFDHTENGDTLYDTPKTQQAIINNIYAELVEIINDLELRKATTETLVEALGSGDDIMSDESLYDHEALDANNENIWDEFVQAFENAKNYKDVTVINETQVLEAEDRLEKAIKALVLYVDTFAPVVTIHNTQTDLNKFYEEHSEELANTIPSADKMVTASYMTPNLGGYTLYVYTNQLNPQIVVSLKDTTSALNTDGSQRTVTTSKPEKMSVSAQAMKGVTANVITPVHDVDTGMAISSVSKALTGTDSVSTQTAKNAAGGYDVDSSAYLILSPQFSNVDGTQQAAAYTIDATDSAVEKDAETGEISSTANGVDSFKYASGDNKPVKTTEDGKITVFVYYMNSMPADGNDNGVNADGSVNGSAVLTHHEYSNIGKDKWSNGFAFYRLFNGAVRNWEFSDSPATLATGAAYVDPTFGENNFGSFIYKIDPNATEGLDYVVANEYFKNGEAAAKKKFISELNSNSEFIATFNEESKEADSTKFISYGAGDNWVGIVGAPYNGELMFIHVADRFGNVCNRIVEVNHYDQLKPELEANGVGKVTVTEPGGSGVAKVDLFNYMGTQGSSLYIDYLFDMLHVDDFTYVSEDNTFTIKTGAANAGKLFTVAVTDNAGNVGSVPVNADANGDILLTVDETYNNVVKYKADTSDVSVNTGEDLEVIEFVFNNSETIKLNFIEPSSIVKAGPDGNVFAKQKGEPLSIVVKSGVEAIKLYNVDNGTEEIWTADKATVKDNGDGTSTWTVKYTFTEGTHNYTATAKVDGAWEITPVAFSFVATTKSVEVKLIVAGIGKIRFGYNEGSYSNVPVMSKKIVPYGSVVTLEAVQTEAGSDFYYWTNNSSNRIISASAVYKFTAVTDMDLTSQFTTNECFNSDKKLVVYVNNAENLVENFELAEGEDYKVPAAPSLPEHVFKEWSMTKEEILASDEKMIIVRPVYSLVVKNTVTLTEGNWTTTGAGVYESVDNDRALVSISASATNAAGESFLYWIDAETGDIASYNRSYTFHAIKDTELTPVYGDASAVVPVPVARISTAKYDSASKKVNFYAERSIPAGYDLIQTGIIVTKTASVGTDEDAFVLGASGVGKGLSNSTAANGYYAGAVSATAGTVVYARAYVIYQNADGDIITDYSTIASYNA